LSSSRSACAWHTAATADFLSLNIHKSVTYGQWVAAMMLPDLEVRCPDWRSRLLQRERREFQVSGDPTWSKVRIFQYQRETHMRKFLKLAAAGAAIGAGLLSQAALADTALPSTGNGELVLYATYTSGGTVFTYARGTGVQINAVNGGSNAALLADASYAPGNTLSMSFANLNADPNMTSFLAAAAAASQTVQWAIMAGDNTGASNRNPGSNRYLSTTTSNFGSNAVSLVNSNIVAQWNGLYQMQLDTNVAIATGVALDKASVAPNGQYGQGAYNNSGDWFGTGFANSAAMNSSQNLYLLTGGGGGSTATARDYLVGVFTMDASGNLSFTSAGTGAVPLPAAVWLFGSGLLGLAGVGRRKRAA
jgi:hypothetical protein